MREQRMVVVAMRHLSGIQKMIQGAHALVEYQLKFGTTAEYLRWAKKDKTLIVLESNTDAQLLELHKELKKLKVNSEIFIEPDLGDVTTAIAFLLDEGIWNTSKYPYGIEPRDLAIRELKSKFKLASN